MENRKPQIVDEYIAGYPMDVQEKLERMRATIREAALEAEEKISYQMPTYAQASNRQHPHRLLGVVQKGWHNYVP